MDVQSAGELPGASVEPRRQRIRRLAILDACVDAVDMGAALDFVESCVRNATHAACILSVNPEKIYILRRDLRLKRFFESAALLIPDGIGVVAAARLLHGVRLPRVAGVDLMQRICEAAPARGYRLFILGATEEVNAAAVARLRSLYPRIQIAGRANGYIAPAENDHLIRRINAARADVLFAGLGSPRQELWLRANAGNLNVSVCQAVGGALDVIAGTVRRAPPAWQAAGLEWAYRLLKQPSRAPRQLNLVRFAFDLLFYKTAAQFPGLPRTAG